MDKAKHSLLIVEDDPGLQSQLRWSFDGLNVVVAGDRESAIAEMLRVKPPVVTLDLGLPPDPGGASEGLATLAEILKIRPETKVIVITGNDDREHAVKAIGLGAYDFYQKPIEAEVLQLIVERAYRLHALEVENQRLTSAQCMSPLVGIVTNSSEMLKVCRTVEKVAPTGATVLLLGESGTGKELLAMALHELSPRRDNPFIAINCAAIPETLLESELFGYEKGAFTGASKLTIGKIECANGGTLFLDEIGDLPMLLQVKLLRFLQQRTIERLGGRKEIPVDVRVICATHQDLPVLVKQGRFREDLYYRICEISVKIPPLREREGDIVLLARKFLNQYNQLFNKNVRGFTRSAIQAMEGHAWPGNVRELENKIKRAVIMVDNNQISPDDLELGAATPDHYSFTLREAKEQAERLAVQRAMSMFNGNVSHAAEMLEVSRPTLYDLIKKFNLGV